MPTDPETRAKGAHYLEADGPHVAKIVQAAAIKPGEAVLDVGAGRGAITQALCKAVAPGGRVVAVESEPDLAGRLKRSQSGLLDVLQGDVLKVELPSRIDAVVANPPYRILPAILRRLLDHGFGRAVLVMPQELAQRLTAVPKSENYGRLTVQVAHQAKCEMLFSIPRRAFDPPPAVASAVVKVTPKGPDSTQGVVPAVLDAILDAAWDGRAKTLRHALAPLDRTLSLPPQDISDAIAMVNGDGRRFADVSPWEFAVLARHLAACQEKRAN